MVVAVGGWLIDSALCDPVVCLCSCYLGCLAEALCRWESFCCHQMGTGNLSDSDTRWQEAEAMMIGHLRLHLVYIATDGGYA